MVMRSSFKNMPVSVRKVPSYMSTSEMLGSEMLAAASERPREMRMSRATLRRCLGVAALRRL